MLNKAQERELCYLVTVDEIRELPGYDRVESARIGGWWCIVPKNQFHVGSIGIYFEIDSRVPEDNHAFDFMAKRHYKVKTLKMCASVSQGLLMHPSDFDWVENENSVYINGKEHKVDDESRFLTKELGVVYAEDADNKRKANTVDKYKKMAGRHPKLFKNPLVRKLYKTNWGKKLLFVFFGKKKDKKNWPVWVVRTDEERAQNLPHLFNLPEDVEKKHYIATEKIDGTSTTFTLKQSGLKREYYVCSRNVCFDSPKKKCYYDTNVYLEMSEKYDMRNKMERMLDNAKKDDVVFITIQGETYGSDIQRRDYSMIYHDLAIFNVIFGYKDGTTRRLNPLEMVKYLEVYKLPTVPVVNEDFVLPNTCDELLEMCEGYSRIDGLPREGLVFRALDGVESFKAVSNSFLLKYHG